MPKQAQIEAGGNGRHEQCHCFRIHFFRRLRVQGFQQNGCGARKLRSFHGRVD
jgi:hypothetical protein